MKCKLGRSAFLFQARTYVHTKKKKYFNKSRGMDVDDSALTLILSKKKKKKH